MELTRYASPIINQKTFDSVAGGKFKIYNIDDFQKLPLHIFDVDGEYRIEISRYDFHAGVVTELETIVYANNVVFNGKIIELDVESSTRTISYGQWYRLIVHPIDRKNDPVLSHTLGSHSNVDNNLDSLTVAEDGHLIQWDNTAGQFTTVDPTGFAVPNHGLTDHSDATITAPSDGQALIYNNGTGQWENKTIPQTGFEYQYVADYNAVLVDGQFTFRSTPTRDFRIMRVDNQGIDRTDDIDLAVHRRFIITDNDHTTSDYAQVFLENFVRFSTASYIEFTGIGGVLGSSTLTDGNIYYIYDGGVYENTITYCEDFDATIVPVEGHVVTWNDTSNKFELRALPVVDHGLNDHTDVTLTAPSNGQILVYNNGTGQWENQLPTYTTDTIVGARHLWKASPPLVAGEIAYVDGTNTLYLTTSSANAVSQTSVFGTLKRGSVIIISERNDGDNIATFRLESDMPAPTIFVYSVQVTASGNWSSFTAGQEYQVIVVPIQIDSVNQIADVNVTNQADNDILRWDSGTSKYINELKGQVPADTGANINPPISAYDTAGQVLYNQTIEKLYFGKGGTTVEEVVSYEPSFGYSNISETNPDVWLQPQNIGGSTGSITWTPTVGGASVLAQGSNSQITTVGTKQAIETDATINGFIDIDLGQNVTGANGFTLGVVVYDLLSVQGQRQVTLYSGTGGDFFDPKNILLMYCNGGKVEGFFNQLTSMPYSGTTLPFTTSEPSFFVFRYDPATNLFTVYRQRATDVQVYSVVPSDFNGATAMDDVLANQLLFGREYSNSSFSAFKFSEIIFWDRYLSDTELTNVSKGMMEEYALRVAPSVDANLALNQLSDVTLSNPVLGQQLILNGANEWVNGVANSQLGHQMIYRTGGAIPSADGEWSFTGSALLIHKNDADGNDLTFLVGVPRFDPFLWYHRTDTAQYAYTFTTGLRIDQGTYWEFPAQGLLGITEDGAQTVMIWSPNVRELITKMEDVSDTAATIQGQVLAWDVPQGEYQPKILDISTDITGTLPETSGGTGQSTYTVGDILYSDATDSLAKLPDVAVGNALISGGVGVAPSYGKIGLTTHVSGTLPVANGGTGATTHTAGNFLIGDGTNAVTSLKTAPAGDVVGTSDAQTLTNKTIAAANNTLTIAQNDLSDTIVSAPASGQLLRYNGSNFVNSTIPMGSIYWRDNATVTTITTQKTVLTDNSNFYKVLGTSTLKANMQFDMPANNVLRYTGTETKHFHIVVQFSGVSDGGNDRVCYFTVVKNIVENVGDPTVVSTFDDIVLANSMHSTRDSGNAIHTDVMLSTNDTLSLCIANTTNTDDQTIKHFYIFALGM